MRLLNWLKCKALPEYDAITRDGYLENWSLISNKVMDWYMLSDKEKDIVTADSDAIHNFNGLNKLKDSLDRYDLYKDLYKPDVALEHRRNYYRKICRDVIRDMTRHKEVDRLLSRRGFDAVRHTSALYRVEAELRNSSC